MQQFLLPSSEGGASQIINIPISLLSQGNQQPISFITANGQIFQLPNYSVTQNENNSNNNTNTSSSASTAVNATSSSTASTASTTTTTANQQQQALVINSQGQIISLPVLQPQGNTQQAQQQTQVVNTNNLTNFNQNTSNTSNTNQTNNNNNNTNNNNNNNNNNHNNSSSNNNNSNQQTVSLSQINFASLANNGGVQLQTLNAQNRTNATVVNAQGQVNGGTPIKTLLEEDDKSDNDMDNDNGPTIANMPPANNNNNLTGGLQTTHVTHHATTVDGVNLDEIREFAKAFKLRRLALGLTQTQVGQALSATKGPAYSQSAICRFEKLDITPKSAAKIKPVLEKWMQEAELKYADRLGLKTGNQQNFADLLGSDSTKKRKRRTSFTPQALEILNEAFEKNTHPSGTGDLSNQGADMTMLANKLNYDREVIRVWFCNKRQALKNTIKKFKAGNGGIDDEAISPSSQMSPSHSQGQLNTSSQQIQLQNQQVQQQVQQQQQLQQSPIQQNNVQQVQNTVNVVSSISQSLANVVSGTSTLGSSSPKTVITLQAPTPASAQPVQQQQSTPSTTPSQSTTTTTTLKIEPSQALNNASETPQQQSEQQLQSQNL